MVGVPGTPRRRARREFAAAQGKTTSPTEFQVEVSPPKGKHQPEVTVQPVEPIEPVEPVAEVEAPKKDGRGASRERMLELVEIRRQRAAAGDTDAMGGRPKTKFSRAEITERALEKLEPHALKVLGEQVKNPDLDPSDRRAAAIKILEYRRGKPMQAVQVDSRNVNTIRFETAAWIPGMDKSSSASLAMGDILELESGEVEEAEVDASPDE